MVKTHQIKISLNVFNILTRPNNLESFGGHFPPSEASNDYKDDEIVFGAFFLFVFFF